MEGTRLPLGILIVGSTAVSIFIIASLAIGEWTTYCFWHFGLVAVSHINDSTYISDADNLGDLHDDVCDDDSFKDYVEGLCPGFCNNLENFELAGLLMLLAGIASLLSQIAFSLLASLKVIKTDFNLRISYIFLFLCTGAFIFSFLLYFIIINPANIDDTKSYADNWVAKSGVAVATVTCFLIIGFNVLAYLFIQKIQRATTALLR